MHGFNYLYDDEDYYYRQLPTTSTAPSFPTMPTSPVNPIYPVKQFFTAKSPSTMAAGMATAATIPVLTNPGYTQAFLRTQIGKRVRVEFLVGTNTFIDRSGTLEDVGISYIVLREAETNDRVMCDLYSIKFVTFFE